MKNKTHILRVTFRKSLATLLAAALPFQLISSCGPSSPRREQVSHALGKTELDFERQHDPSTSLREGGGWSSAREASERYGADVHNHVAPQVYSRMTVVYVCVGDECNSDLPHDLPSTPFGYGVQDHNVRIYLDGTVPKKGQGAPYIAKRDGPQPGGDSSDSDHKNRPGFPLNPSNLKTRVEVDSDIATRLSERESKATRGLAELEGQLNRSGKKGGAAPKGGLKTETEDAKGRHSKSAGTIGDVIDKSGSAPSQSKGPLPGSLGTDLEETRKEAKRLGSAPSHDHSGEAAREASDLLDDAEKEAREGNIARADALLREGKWLTSIAGRGPGSTPEPAPQGPIPPNDGPSDSVPPASNSDETHRRTTRTPSETRSEAMRVGLSLYDASGELRAFGLHEIADKAIAAGHFLIEVAIGAARLSSAVDLPLSVMEVFGGVTLGVNASGDLAFREITMLEKAFAFAALGAAGLAFGAGGWAGVVGVGVIGGIGKAATKGLERKFGLGAATKAAEEAAEKAPIVVEKLDDEGIKLLEEALRAQNRRPEKVNEAINSFLEGSIVKEVSKKDRIVYRYHDNNVKANPIGSYVTPEVFPDIETARKALAIDPRWNDMTKVEKLIIPEGTTFFSGTTAPQGGFPGGAVQYFLTDFGASLKRAP